MAALKGGIRQVGQKAAKVLAMHFGTLDKLMAATLQYEVDCTEGTTQEGYLVLRPVTLTYQTASYAQSRQIIDALSASANVNFLSNVDVQYDADKAQYKTVLHLIFFELMP